MGAPRGDGADHSKVEGLPSLNLNERAWALVDDAVTHADLLRVRAHTLNCGARVLDAGVNVPGGLAAGLLLAELCMGGVGHAELTPLTIADKGKGQGELRLEWENHVATVPITVK